MTADCCLDAETKRQLRRTRELAATIAYLSHNCCLVIVSCRFPAFDIFTVDLLTYLFIIICFVGAWHLIVTLHTESPAPLLSSRPRPEPGASNRVSEGGMTRLEILIDLKFLSSSFSS